jgi:hypothetical protein
MRPYSFKVDLRLKKFQKTIEIFLLSNPNWFLICRGVPRLKWFGVEGNYSLMAIDLVGPSLEDMFNYCNRKLTLKTVLMLADQLVSQHENYYKVKGLIIL